MSKFKRKASIQKDESGIAAIFVTMILMLVLSIMVIGFSQVSRREQTNAFNQQLGLEAYYAAESGINDAYTTIRQDLAAINANPAAPPLANSPNDCTGGSYASTQPIISNKFDSSGTGYTCLIVNVKPHAPVFVPSGGNTSVVTHLLPTNPSGNPTALNDLKINWEDDNGGTTSADSANCPFYNSSFFGLFPPNASWYTPGVPGVSPAPCPSVIQVDLVDTQGSFNESTLPSLTHTMYFYPQKSSVSVPWSTIKNGQIYPATCSTSCSVSINGLTGSDYYLKVQYIYGTPPKFTISTSISGTWFKNSEAIIDSTGKSNGSLKREQVYVSLSSSYSVIAGSVAPTPNFAIQTNESICKRLVVGRSGGNDFAWVSIPSSTPADIGNGGYFKDQDVSPIPVPSGPGLKLTPNEITNPCDPTVP